MSFIDLKDFINCEHFTYILLSILLYMPTHKVHRFFEKLILGKEYPWVHRLLDHPFGLNLGIQHRKYFGHDILSILILYYLSGYNDDVLKSALLHNILDRMIKYEESKKLELLIKILDKKD